MKLEYNRAGAWSVLMEFPFQDVADVQFAATRLFSQATALPCLRIRDGMIVHAQTHADNVGGVLVWESIQHHKQEFTNV